MTWSSNSMGSLPAKLTLNAGTVGQDLALRGEGGADPTDPCSRGGRGRTRRRRLGRTPASRANTFDMAVVGSTAAAKYIDMGEAAEEVSILSAQLMRMANVELRCIVEFGMAAAG